MIRDVLAGLTPSDVSDVEEQLASKGCVHWYHLSSIIDCYCYRMYELVVDGKKFELLESMIKINRFQKKVHG